MAALTEYGHLFRKTCDASGFVPQLSLILGPCAGGAAFVPAMTDVVIVADKAAVPQVNACLHEYGSHIIGRLGVPYGEKGVSVICVIMDAPGTAVSALSGKLGMLAGVSAKTVTAKV